MTETHANNSLGFWIESFTSKGWIGVSAIVKIREDLDLLLSDLHLADQLGEYRINEALDLT